MVSGQTMSYGQCAGPNNSGQTVLKNRPPIKKCGTLQNVSEETEQTKLMLIDPISIIQVH